MNYYINLKFVLFSKGKKELFSNGINKYFKISFLENKIIINKAKKI